MASFYIYYPSHLNMYQALTWAKIISNIHYQTTEFECLNVVDKEGENTKEEV